MSLHDGPWCISTDGSYYAGGNVSGIEYHQKLNLLFVTSRESGVLVYDTTSSTLLKKSTIGGATERHHVMCKYIAEKDGLLICDGEHMTFKKDLNGVYLLDTALNCKIEDAKVTDVIQLELTVSDAEVLLKSVQSYDILKVDKMQEVIDRLQQVVEASHSDEDNQKKAKWCTVTLEHSQSVLLYVFQHIMMQLKSKGDNSSALPISATLTERSGYYAPEFKIDTRTPLDRALMYSEAARLATFENWPHMGYQWAKPETMSRAGFYHEPTASNDDRSMCFTCNVCLVCWEKTDEPWSEHERHQPNCPFIKGLPTQNVPLAVYYASQPAVKSTHKCVTTTKYGEEVFLAVVHSDESSVKMYTMGRQLDLCRHLIIKPQPNTSEYMETAEVESHVMGEIIATYKVTTLALVTRDDERSGLSLVIGSLYNHIVQLASYETGYMSSTAGRVDLDPSLAASFSSPEALAEAIYLEQRYLVAEPPKERGQKGVVVPSEAKRTHSLEIPDCFCYPGFEIQMLEQSLDRRLLIVYIAYKDLDNFPTHAGLQCGALITYEIQDRSTSSPWLLPTPYTVHMLETPDDCLVHLHQLSQEFSSTRETEGADEEVYHMLVTKRSGAITLFTVKQLKEIVSYKNESYKFLHTVYSSGIDRVCASTSTGEVIMLQINPTMSTVTSTSGDAVNSSAVSSTNREIDELFARPLTAANLKQLSELTEGENLSGRFTATLPSCWSEVQQDQLQRKHPQHLQQSMSSAGEAAFVTKTWKLQPEGDTATREHIIELALPKITNVGHVDVRFLLQSRAKEIPDVRVALLCYKTESNKSSGKLPARLPQSSDSSFLPQEFLDKHKLQLLSAPVSLTAGGDVTGQSGVLVLTSPALLKIKPRTLVIYMKYNMTKKDKSANQPFLDIEAMLFPQVRVPNLGPSTPPRGPRGGMKGKAMDLIEELSVSVRRTKSTRVSSEKMIRLEMLDHRPLHRHLVEISYTGQLAAEQAPLLSTEENKNAAMRILGWIATLQMNDIPTRKYANTVLSVIEEKLSQLIEHCLIKGSRSTGHTLSRLLINCTELSRRLGDVEYLTRFTTRLMDRLLEHLNKLQEAHSSGAVQSYLLLLGRVKCLNPGKVCKMVCEQLLKLSELYYKSSDDPDMSRLSSYGLTGCPYDTDLFECSLPAFITKHLIPPEKAAATIVAQKQAQHQNLPKPKDDPCPLVDLSDPSCQGLTPTEQFGARVGGLLEVEPLQYTINSYSEYIHVAHGSNTSNVTPVFYGSGNANAPDPSSLTQGLPINVPQAVIGSDLAKVKKKLKVVEDTLLNMDKSDLSSLFLKKEKMSLMQAFGSGKITSKSSASAAGSSEHYPTFPGQFPLMPLSSSLWPSQLTAPYSSKPTSVVGEKQTSQSVPSTPYPSIQAILQPPSEFTLIAGRMNSGNARRYIVLDFGQPIRLTDVILPACVDLASFAVDVWLEGEIIDSQRLAVCTDVFTKCLVLSDIQPACVCKYLKITYVPRNAGPGQTYRIPLGVFYGHAYVFPWETPSNTVCLRTTEEVRKQINVYTTAVQDIRCCYTLASGRLKILLQSAENQSVDNEQEDNPLCVQIQQTYEECLRLQQQLNLADNAIRRLRSALPAACEADAKQATPPPCRDKLRFLIEAFLSLLISRGGGALPSDLSRVIPAPVAKKLFNHLCLHGNRRMQILTGNLIVQVCSGQDWYGDLFEEILKNMFSSSYSSPFPKLKVFGLLVSMAQRSLSTGRKASHRVCANSLKLLSNQLSPLVSGTSGNSPTGYVDMELVSWLLLFFSKLTDSNYNLEDPLLVNRWDFLSTEQTISKHKVYHRFTPRQKAHQERAQSTMRKKFNSGPQRVPRPSSSSSLPSKRKDRMMMMKKQMFMRHEMEMMKMRKFDTDHYPESKMRRRMAMMMGDPEAMLMEGLESDGGNRVAVILERGVVLPVVRGVLCLLLRVNFSCHSDMFILGCKVLSRLCLSARPTLKLGEVATAEQLKTLIYNITHCKYNSRTQSWAGDWGKHAVACFLGDLVEGERANLDIYDNGPDPEDATPDIGESSSGTQDRGTDQASIIDMMMGEGMGLGPRGFMPPFAGPEGMRSIDLMRMMHRDEMMMDEMMEMDMEMDMMFGSEMEDMMDFYGKSETPKPPIDGPPMVNEMEAPMSSAIDSRLKYSCDSAAELRLQLWISHELFNQQKAMSIQGPPIHKGAVRSSPTSQNDPAANDSTGSGSVSMSDADSLYTQNGNESESTEELLGQIFSELIYTEKENLDLESILTLYLNINEEFREDAKEGFDPALKPHISLDPQAIETLVNCVASGQHLTIKGWTQLLRVLTILLNSNLNDEDRVFALTLCASETFQQLVIRFLRCATVVGPVTVKAFHDLLTRIQLVHETANAELETLADMLLCTIGKHLSESYARRSLDGALDAQCTLIEFVHNLPTKPLTGHHVLNLFDSSINITSMLIKGQHTLVPIAEDETELDLTLLFQTPSKKPSLGTRDNESGPQSDIPTQNHLVVALLRMLGDLLKRSFSPPLQFTGPDTDSSKLANAAPNDEHIESMDIEEDQGRQTDEQKRSEGNSHKHRCLHLMDVDREPTLADLVINNRSMVATLIQCLASCRSTPVVSRHTSKVPVTVGDGVFLILTLLFRSSTNYYQLLELLQEHLSSGSIVTLSDPLRLFIKLALNCEHTISKFIELDGINCLTSRFVESYMSSPDTASGMITSVLQHLTTTYNIHSPPPSSTTQGQLMVAGTNNETLMNFAPLGNVFSSNPSVGPMYSLIQANQTHRRARTAPWSHKFSFDQPWVDINIQLPCSVLIKEVQIHPYLSSIHSAGPSHVTVELSHDGLPTLPSRQPMITSGVTCIKVRFLQPEIVSMVTLRLHRPVDSSSIGLTQLCVLGYPGLCDPDTAPKRTNSSLSWLQLLYHCIDHVPGVSSSVIAAVQDKLQLLHTCCSLLMSNLSPAVAAQLEKVIIELSVRSIDISKTVLDILLKHKHHNLIMLSSESMSTDATAEILCRICMYPDSHTTSRLLQLLEWLEGCAEFACQTGATTALPGVQRPSKLHIQCVASILLKSAELNNADVSALLSQQLFTRLYDWSMNLGKDLPMKRVVDAVIAVMCHINLSYFQSLVQKFFVSAHPASNQTEILLASVSDDAKDDVQQEMLTDESKGHFRFSEVILMDSKNLSLLATSSHSTACAQALIDSTLLRVLCQAVLEFCLKELQQCEDATARPAGAVVCVNWATLPTVLKFFSQCASANPILKDWLTEPEGRVFWAILLELFSGNGNSSTEKQSAEPSVILFFKTIILNHTGNQRAFSLVMCNLLRVIAQTSNSVAGSSLSSFMKNLLLETILEDEKVFVTVTNRGVNFRFDNNGCLSSCSQLGVGVGHSTRTVLTSIYATMAHLSAEVAKPAKKKNVIKKKPTDLKRFLMDPLASIAPPSIFDSDDVSAALTSLGENAEELSTDTIKMRGVSARRLQFVHSAISDCALEATVTVGDVIMSLLAQGLLAPGSERIELELYSGPPDVSSLSISADVGSALKVFTGLGGLALLAEHLPLLYPEITQSNRAAASAHPAGDLSDQDYEFVTQVKGISLGPTQYETTTVSADGKAENMKKTATGVTTIPPHSLVAFGLFLRLPGYAEMLIKRRVSAKCLLRLVLGVRDDGEGVAILASSVASTLPTLPFTNLKLLYESSPLTTDDGLMLRRASLEIGVLHLVLACLAALSHHSPRKPPAPGCQHDKLTQMATLMANQVLGSKSKSKPPPAKPFRREEAGGQSYWAKGTGFGTGSTSTQWDLEQLLLKQQSEEEHVTCMLDIISALINPDDSLVADANTVLPSDLFQKLSDSCLLPAIASYLRNDSVLDMSRHVPLYKSVYRILRALASCQDLVRLLGETVSQSDSSTLESLSSGMAKCVATYKSRLKPTSQASGSRANDKNSSTAEEEDQANSLNELAVVLANTHDIITKAVKLFKERIAVGSPTSHLAAGGIGAALIPTSAETYESIFKELQFDSFKFLETTPGGSVRFLSHHHYEMSVRQGSTASSGNNARTRRLAQEAVTLSTSLPLSASSSVFVRCDEERMDVMKVLITGPSDTPYMNGCFEFDVFFPTDYPTSPPLINLQTTGNHKIRFNPNLYNDGKVCLSVLNTWHGRPEEKWNAQTSSFLQVLVSIQSLILVNEPYFNEPGYERSRGTAAGTANCREYDSNIRQATVKFAMLEMLKHPPACFKDVIEKHFWIKRKEIKEQIESWVADQEIASDSKAGVKAKSYQTISHNNSLLKKHLQQLLAELQAMKAPEGCSEPVVDLTASTSVSMDVTPVTKSPEAFGTTPSTSFAGIMDSLPEEIVMGMMPPNISSMIGLGFEDEWPNVQDISSNSSEVMDTGEDILMSPQEASYQEDLNAEEFDEPGMFI